MSSTTPFASVGGSEPPPTSASSHHHSDGPLETFQYDNKIVWMFIVASIVFGVVGMTVGLTIAFQFFTPGLNITQYGTFGRLRPLHTNSVIFAFVGNAIFAGVYYSLQRLLKARMFSDALSKFHFWGWQLIILCAAVTLPLGLNTSHEYAELEWWIDIMIAVVWVAFGVNMIGTIVKRRVRHMYVAIWFYIATFVTVAVLHIVNSVQLPISFTKSYYVYAGVQDALVQWWYGHNAVAFFLTTPFLGLMYYFLPKAANRPVYSYRLSIVHFWSLIFIYIWAGPHHLLYSSLPDWAQSLGTAFSIMLIAPSWGGMLNGLLTLRGAWDRVREDPILKMFVVGVTCYGMATLEGPLLSLKVVNGLAHFTDWIPAHVHVGALGWNGLMTFAMFYWITPRIFNTQLFSKKLANTHFWLATLGIVFWVIPMYFSGWTQGMMWKEFNPDGTLKYSFMDTVMQILPMYMLRAVGGSLYLTGVLVMAYNLTKTVATGRLNANETAQHPALNDSAPDGKYAWHRVLERKPALFTLLTVIAILIGGLIELVPTFLIKSNVETIAAVKPYTPLEVHGRDIYIREGCNACHTQWVRPMTDEVVRYQGILEKGIPSQAGEFVYDHTFLWGSKRTGPDLHRVGKKYPDSWHYRHMLSPSDVTTNSIMPSYSWLFEQQTDFGLTETKIRALSQLGVPYDEKAVASAAKDAEAQAATIHANLKQQLPDMDLVPADREIVALIAYLQRLGTDIKAVESSFAAPEETASLSR